MTATKRWLNRALIIVIGLLLAAAGTAAALTAAAPGWRRVWTTTAARWARPAAASVTGPVGPWPHGFWLAAVPLACATLIALLLAFIFRQGRGSTRVLYRLTGDPADGPAGSVTIDTAVAGALLRDALVSHPDVVSCAVGAYRARRARVLKLTLALRRGASPTSVCESADRALADWDSRFGARLPAVIQLNQGAFARTVRRTRPAAAAPVSGASPTLDTPER